MATEILNPPIAKTVKHTYQHLGKTYDDHYAWLQDKNDPEVIAYLEAENAFAKAGLAHTQELQETLFQEMKGRIQEDDNSVPERRGSFYYYWRVEAGKQYRKYCRQHGSMGASEEVLLDENVLAEGLSYCKIAAVEPSPDNHLLAYLIDTTGSWVFDLVVIDIKYGSIVAGPIHNVGYTMAWASDNKTLFYTIFDDAHRPYKLMRHQIGSAESTEIYHETDDAFNVWIERSRSGAYMLMTAASGSTSEVRVMRADQPLGAFKLIEPRQAWVEYYVEHHGEQFLIRTNEDAENFKLMAAPAETPTKDNWWSLIPHRADVMIDGVGAFRDYIVVVERKGGLHQLRISDANEFSQHHYVKFPEPVYAVRLDSNPEFNMGVVRFVYSSLITPESTVDYDMKRQNWDIRKRQEIPSGYDASQYESVRIMASAPDGAQVPMSVVYKKGITLDGSNPTLLYGYGSYGIPVEASFSPNRLSLLDRGFVWAIAHIRGGNEMGRAWYQGGRLMQKMNTFTDFIACAEALIAKGYTSNERLAILGGSAGGLLVSAVANLRPDLFKAVVAMVPFTNVITAMLDPNLPLTVIEYEQWGNPSDTDAFDYMLSYSPYENIEAKKYPHIYARAGINDLQVPFWDPAKWVARLRAQKTDGNHLYLITEMGAGHAGASGRYDKLHEWAEIYAFLIDTVGN